jgi:membrane-associated phospholipid phosphatase
MHLIRNELARGIFGEGWRDALITIAIGAVTFAVSLIYDPLNHGPYRIFLRTPIDDAIPLVAAFVIPYVSLKPFLYGSLVLFLLFRVRVYRSAALSMIAVFTVSYLFYFFLQSFIERPALTGDDALTGMIRDVYASDQPYNDFPSLHASLSTLIALHWLHVSRRVGAVVAIWAALIVVSTVFVKQHYVADMVAGAGLAYVVSRFTLARVASRAPSTGGQLRSIST